MKSSLVSILFRKQSNASDTVPIESFYNGDKSSRLELGNEMLYPTDNGKISTPSEPKKCFCPSPTSILLMFLLISVFIVLPLIYLFHCFGLISSQWSKYDPLLYYHLSGHRKTQEDVTPRGHRQVVVCFGRETVTCDNIRDDHKFDCFPEEGANANQCAARGCCWTEKRVANSTSSPAKMGVPYCYYPKNYSTYKFVNTTATDYGLISYLQLDVASHYPGNAKLIQMIVKYETESRIHVKFIDPTVQRYESPLPQVPLVNKASAKRLYSFFFDPQKLGFRIIRDSDKTVIFDSIGVGGLIFSDQFLQMSGLMPTWNIYGLGEQRSRFRLSMDWQKITLFNLDQYPLPKKNLYGSQPFYLAMENGGNSHGVFLLNSNAMDVILQPAPAITYRTIGGVLDFYFFLGPSPADVVRQYTELIGRPYMPPYWGLGFHLCRFGVGTLNRTREILKRNMDAGLPIDVQWNDLDYMKSNNDFTYDNASFHGLPKFVDDLHAKGMHYVPLIDAGISSSEPAGTYPPFDVGKDMGIFVKYQNGDIFNGKVWNRKSTVWPDFTNPSTVDYWTKMLKSLHDQIKFDGAWIDMNEPSNFYSGAVNGCPASQYETPPYVPGVEGGKLFYKTICMNTRQWAGLHYDVHNLYGLTEAVVTSFAMTEIRGKRPFVISRSTFAGHGHFAGHWSGDVVSAWEDMKYSISELMSFSLFGVPLMGADICGFNGNTTAALCQRWMQLGAFYPFSRNHNTDDGIDQDPAAFGKDVLDSSIKALNVRYSLLPYIYTLFWAAHIGGDTVARPLFFEYPNDENTYAIDEQFMLGPHILVAPVLKEGDVQLSLYLPAGVWYDFYTLQLISSKGQNLTVDAPLDTIPILLRGGSILVRQEPKQTSTETRKSNLKVLAAADETFKASGELFWDDGDSLNTVENRQYSHIVFEMDRNSLNSYITWWGFVDIPPLEEVTILGVASKIRVVKINSVAQEFSYDEKNKVLFVTNISIALDTPMLMTWVE